MYQTNFPCYFASANTSNGFISKFDKIFDPEKLNQIFIIKGGPGTGKSSLMKSVEKAAAERKYEIEDFLCSSDSNSLDGIIIKDKKIAILDGTKPHCYEPSFPGAVENIINTGSFWNIDALTQNKREIIALIKEKTRYYKRAYRFLNAYGETEEELLRFHEKALLSQKAEKSVRKILEKIHFSGGSGKEEIRLDETVCELGVTKLDTFEKESDTVYLLCQNEYVAIGYINLLYKHLKNKKYDLVIGFSHKFPSQICSIFLPKEKISFLIRERKDHKFSENKQYRFVNMKRFYDTDLIRDDLQKIHFGKRCSQMLLSGAVEALGEAKKIHADLEKMYVSAMDFNKFNEERNLLISKIFS